ncbi:hypothetical protein CONPUDRAFT_85016, partial [Coniophora puteana RWD-64-598 SS2]
STMSPTLLTVSLISASQVGMHSWVAESELQNRFACSDGGKGSEGSIRAQPSMGSARRPGERGRCGYREPELAVVEHVFTGGELGAPRVRERTLV